MCSHKFVSINPSHVMHFVISYCFNCFLLHTGVYFTHIVLFIFDKYVDQIHTCVEMNISTFTEERIQCDILGNPTNTIVYHSYEVLKLIRANIVQNGTVIFLHLIINVLEKMEDSHELTIKLKGMAMK